MVYFCVSHLNRNCNRIFWNFVSNDGCSFKRAPLIYFQTLFVLILMVNSICMIGCAETVTETPSPIIRLSPDALRSHLGSSSIETIILEGNGRLSDQSLGLRFPNLRTLHLQFTPDIASLPEDIALCSQLQEIQIFGTSMQEVPSTLGTLPIHLLRIEHRLGRRNVVSGG